MSKLSNLILLLAMISVSVFVHSAERVFFEDMEATNFSEHFMERSFGTAYSSYWDQLQSGSASVTRSTDAYSGSYSMRTNLFAPAPGRNIGLGNVAYGNTSNFSLQNAITGTKMYIRWKQKYEAGADWGGFMSKQVYLNYRDQGDFVLTLVKSGGNNWIISIHTNNPYVYTLNQYFNTSTNVFDEQWHDMELFLDWTGQEDSNGGSCTEGQNSLSYNSSDGNGIVLFRIDGVTQYEKTNTCFYTGPVSGSPIHHLVLPSNRSGTGGSGSQTTWVDNIEIWDDLPDSATLPPPNPPTLE
jgi:hypothetical protein